MAFSGYLIKATKTNAVFPHEYINAESYEVTPNQREELKAYRDENSRDLYRVTASGKKSRIDFSLWPGLHVADLEAVSAFFYNGEAQESDPTTAHAQRKIQITFWDTENQTYKTGTFYRPNTKYPIAQITNSDVTYGEITISLIEY